MGRKRGGKNSNPKPLSERFWEKVDKRSDDECWEWQAFVHPSGYGTIAFNKKMLGVHRVSWEIHFGKIPVGLQVCHHCDNRKCVNPKHLFLGTHLDNMRDRDKKGRLIIPDNKGEKHGNSRLTRKEVLKIRELYNNKIYSCTEIGRMFGMAHQTISKIGRRKAWSWLE